MEAFFVGLVAGALLTIGITLGVINNLWLDDLVQSGHAEYYLDEDHNRQWRMKECE